MKIVFTGGGTGGHFYPIIAVAEEINNIAKEKRLLSPKLYYIGPEPYDSRALYENNIIYKQSPAGKLRRYFSPLNFFDICKTGIGIIKTILQMFFIYPDVIFSKGGYASFPTVVAARLLRIPLFIHESDAVPGRVNRFGGKFAEKIALGYPDAARYFDPKKVAHTGNPVRRGLFMVPKESGQQYFELDENIPTILVLGGSQGATHLNDLIIDILPGLLEQYQIIHQSGEKLFEAVKNTANVVLENNPYRTRYRPFGFLNAHMLRMAAGASSLIISRAGSGSIFEIAAWERPSIIIPIPTKISHDQRHNAFSYARSGAAVVIEEGNLTPNLLSLEIARLMDDKDLRARMKDSAKKFSRPDAARKIAEAIVAIALGHE